MPIIEPLRALFINFNVLDMIRLKGNFRVAHLLPNNELNGIQ